MRELQALQASADKRWGFVFEGDNSSFEENERLLQSMMFCTLAICGEAGELANKIKKLSRASMWGVNTAKVDIDDVREELADILAYLLKLANEMKVDLEEAYREKMERNDARFRRT